MTPNPQQRITIVSRTAKVEPQTAGSWWQFADRERFTARAESHMGRMRLSRVGVPLETMADANRRKQVLKKGVRDLDDVV
jgi:hypothetical protein